MGLLFLFCLKIYYYPNGKRLVLNFESKGSKYKFDILFAFYSFWYVLYPKSDWLGKGFMFYLGENFHPVCGQLTYRTETVTGVIQKILIVWVRRYGKQQSQSRASRKETRGWILASTRTITDPQHVKISEFNLVTFVVSPIIMLIHKLNKSFFLGNFFLGK